MPQTQIPSGQIQDGGIQRSDLCVAGAAGTNVIAKAIQGSGIQLNASGAEAGTGDVTIGLAQIAAASILGNSGPSPSVPAAITAWANPSWLTSLPWSKITGTPTTLAGYGITDAVNPAFTGDVTKAAGGTVTALANIPSSTPAAGSIIMAGIASPTAIAGSAQLYVDTTSKNFCSKDPSGNISHAVRTKTAVSKQYLTYINDDGSVGQQQPVWGDITGTPTTLSGYGIASPLPAAQGGTGNTLGAEPPLGNPPANSYILSSTTAGARSWIPQPTGGGGNVSNQGTPLVNQIAIWTDATHISGVSILGTAAGGTGANNTPTSGYFLRGTGSNFAASAIGTADLPQINLSGDVSGGGASGSITTTYNNAVPTAKGGFPTGGTVGQHLIKQSSTNYDAGWKSFATLQDPLASNPSVTGIASRMFGIGALFTPTATGKVLVMLITSVNTSVAGFGQFTMKYGTGAAPTNGVTAVGTSLGYVYQTTTGAVYDGVTFIAVLTGLAIGTQYWFDLSALGTVSNSQNNAILPTFTIVELP